MSSNHTDIAGQDCYDTILEYFNSTNDTPVEQEIWKNKAYAKLI
jgi:hypothetical protein